MSVTQRHEQAVEQSRLPYHLTSALLEHITVTNFVRFGKNACVARIEVEREDMRRDAKESDGCVQGRHTVPFTAASS